MARRVNVWVDDDLEDLLDATMDRWARLTPAGRPPLLAHVVREALVRGLKSINVTMDKHEKKRR